MDSNALNKLPNKIKQRIETAVDTIRETVGECEILLFGSFAKGNWLLDSDIDLLIISDKFKEKDYISRIITLKNHLLKKEITRTHLIPLTREEFNDRKKEKRDII